MSDANAFLSLLLGIMQIIEKLLETLGIDLPLFG